VQMNISNNPLRIQRYGKSILRQKRRSQHSGALTAATAILVLLLFAAGALAGQKQKGIKIVFRLDDPSAKSCTEIESKLIAAFRQYAMRCTFGVVPFACAGNYLDPAPQELLPLPPERVKMLRQAMEDGVIEIAQHGYSHQTNVLREKKESGLHSEFYGLSYEEQFERIKLGKQFLEEQFRIPITTFIPPFNSYDSNIIKVLDDLHFHHFSAYRGMPVNTDSLLRLVPATCELKNLIQLDLEGIINRARKIPDAAPAIIILFHEFDFKEVNSQRGVTTYDDFVEMLKWISEQKDVCVRSLDQVSGLSAQEYCEEPRIAHLRRILPAAISLPLSYVLPSADGMASIKLSYYRRIFLFYGGILLSCAVSAFVGGKIVFPKSGVCSKLCLYALPVVLVAGATYTFIDGKFGLKGLLVCVILLGSCIGAWGSKLSSYKRLQNASSC